MDYTQLTDSISVDHVGPPVVGVAAAVVGVLIIAMYVRMIVRIIHGPFMDHRTAKLFGYDGPRAESSGSIRDSSSDRDGDGVGGGSPAHRINVSLTSSMSEADSQRLFEEEDRIKGEFRRGERANKDY